jgi:hypothetical protein
MIQSNVWEEFLKDFVSGKVHEENYDLFKKQLIKRLRGDEKELHHQ